MDDTNRPTSKKRTRNVSGLSEEQVQQKRNIDRKAQRAFRQRTRDRIAQLEHDLAELEDSSGQREAQYQTQIDDLRADNQQLLRRLESIASLATSSTVPGEIAFAGLHESPTVWRGVTQPSQPAGVAGVAEGHPDDRDDTGMSAASVQRSQLGPAGAGSQQSAPPFQVPRPDIDCDGPDAHSMNRNNSADLSSDPTIIVRHASIPSVDAFRLPETYRNHRPPPSPPALAEISNDTNSTSIHSPAEAVSVAQETPRGDESHLVGMRPVFAVLPVHISPTCPLDQILLGFFNSQRELLGSGASPETVIGPPRPSAKVLIRPGSSSSIDPISKVMSEVMMTFLYVGKAEQLALFYLMHQTMRWRISPTRENYQLMPTWLRPTVTQVTIPHAAWLDNVPWPGVRDLLIEYPEKYTYTHWTDNFTQNVSVNWQFDTSDALLERDDEITLHSIFEKHVRVLRNWTVSDEFAQLFPDLMPAIYSRD